MTDPAPDLELLRATLALDAADPTPLHRQLYQQLRDLVLEGRLASGARIPPSRQLAQSLGVSRNTVVSAFDQLTAEGFLSARVGEGTRVAQAILGQSPRVDSRNQPARRLSARGEALSEPRRSLPAPGEREIFQPGLPDTTDFPNTSWARILSRRARSLSHDLTAYGHAGGFGPLRESLSAYLTGSRGLRCRPEQVLVCTSAQAAVDLAVRLLTDTGDGAWREAPGYVGAQVSFAATGLRVTGIPVDEHGVDADRVDALPKDEKPRVGYITPSHHFPIGYTLSLSRRLQLLEWSERVGGWIIEDDYDSEFRYANAPIAAVQGLALDTRVVYIGSFAKTLFPGLRVAYLVVPIGLALAFRQAIRQSGQEPALLLQAALHDFLELGHFARHVRTMRQRYAERHRQMIEATRKHLQPWGMPIEADGGLQLTFAFDPQAHPGIDDRTLVSRTKRAGFGVEPLSRYGPPPETPGGLVFGIGTPGSDPIDETVERLANVMAQPERD
ncbi:MAG: PLP-dependent aminotransferase family protein [Pseudomonadota bacterium]